LVRPEDQGPVVKGGTVMKRSLKAFGFVVLDDGRELDTLKTYVAGSAKLVVGVDRIWICSAAPMTGQCKLSLESVIIALSV
jgi:hypothetical protein